MSNGRIVAILATVFVIATATRCGAASERVIPRQGMADVQVIVFPAEMFRGWPGRAGLEDHVTFTYSRAISQSQAIRDFAAYSKITQRTLNDVEVSTEATPLNGGPSIPMTCVTFTTPQLTQVQSGHFDVEPFVRALHAYKHLRLSFIAPGGFRFSGLRSFHNRFVDIDMTMMAAGSSSTYTYDVGIKDGSFALLNLPTTQLDPALQRVASQQALDRKLLVLRIIGIVFVGGVATLAGYFVYSFLAMRPAAG